MSERRYMTVGLLRRLMVGLHESAPVELLIERPGEDDDEVFNAYELDGEVDSDEDSSWFVLIARREPV